MRAKDKLFSIHLKTKFSIGDITRRCTNYRIDPKVSLTITQTMRKIFYACHISVIFISAPNRCFNWNWTFLCIYYNFQPFLSRIMCSWDTTSIKDLMLGEICDTGRISATRILAPKSLRVVVNTNFFFSSKWNFFLELRYVSLRYNRHKIFRFISLSSKSFQKIKQNVTEFKLFVNRGSTTSWTHTKFKFLASAKTLK